MPPTLFIAHTHRQWFDHLCTLASPAPTHLRLDEVNFWSPNAQTPPKRLTLGEPMFFRLGAPTHAIAGYGFHASFSLSDVWLAWELFGGRNGAPDLSSLARLLGRTGPGDLARPLACTVLRDAVFWPEPRWISWTEREGYRRNTQRGRTDDDPARVARLLGEIARDGLHTPRDLVGAFHPLDADARRIALAPSVVREGQGTFRLRLLDAYGRQCAVTREHTEPVLQAAHIQPYLGPESNHAQNGLLLTQEFHTLFDRGLVSVAPPTRRTSAYRLEVSPRIRERWNNGRRYYDYDGRELHVPPNAALRPSAEALEWHRERWRG